jgi:kynurenine formamidase
LVSCENIVERQKLEKSVYLHGMLPVECLGKPDEATKKKPAYLLGKNVEVIEMTHGFGAGVPLWPYAKEDVREERIRYHAQARVRTAVIKNHNMHFATHCDTPLHVEEGYPSLSEVPIERYMGKGVVLDIPKKKWGVVTPEDLERAEPSIEEDDIVIVHTGWHAFWSDSLKYYAYAPGLYKEAAEWLVKKKARAVGLDCQAIDHPLGTRIAQPPPLMPWLLEQYKNETGHEVYEDFPYWEPTTRMLTTHGIPNWENVGGDIDKALGKRCTIMGVPVKWLGGDGSPVRLLAIVEKK